jgi:hypothetical protein
MTEPVGTTAAQWRLIMRPGDCLDHGRSSYRNQVDRAAKTLVESYGSNALRVAAQRAVNAELSGSRDAANNWKQIAVAVRRWNDPAAVS